VPGFPSKSYSVHLYERKEVFISSQLVREGKKEKKKKTNSHLIGGLLSNKFNTLQSSASAVGAMGYNAWLPHVS